MDLLNTLKNIALPCHDNGFRFTDTERVSMIKTLVENNYVLLKDAPLYLLFGKTTIEDVYNPIIISTHIDCVDNIKKCFVKQNDDNTINGTFDNMITNASAIYVMNNYDLPKNVFFAFTGNEEYGMGGAEAIINDMNIFQDSFKAICLDVTNDSYGCDFTVENNFWNKVDGNMYKSIRDLLLNDKYKSEVVLSCKEDVIFKKFLKDNNINYANHYAYCDEGQVYGAEKNIDAFSLCLPVKGHMHSEKGCTTYISTFKHYTEALADICLKIAN